MALTFTLSKMASEVSFIREIAGFIKIPILPINSGYWGANGITGKETELEDSGQTGKVGSSAFPLYIILNTSITINHFQGHSNLYF